jgi:hypothetical protein
MRYGVVTRRRMWVLVPVLAATSLLALASGASAETFNVSTTQQLAEAVAKANGNAQANTIVLASGGYQPSATLVLTDTSGVQTIEGSTSFPGSTLNGGGVEPFPSEILAVRKGVSAKLKNVTVTTGGSAATPAIDDAGALEVESSLLAGNSGASVHVEPAATGTFRNSTISDSVENVGLVSSGTASILNSTIAFNPGGGIDNKGTLKLTNTIVAENTGGDCTAVAATSDHSLDSDGTCGVEKSKVNPLLGKLASNGGPTSTHALQQGSPAIDAGDSAQCPATDQRGFPRPDIPATPCDIGAFEASPAPRFLQNGTESKLENGEKLPVLSWGTLALENSKLGAINCKYAIGGVATDPGTKGTGDLPGEAKIQGYRPYSCTGPACELAGEPVEVTPLGQASNPATKTKETVGRITKAWEAVLIEPKVGEWKLKIGNKKPGSETQVRFSVGCAAQALQPEFTGELNTAIEGGTLIGAAPAVLTFKGAESGELESAIGTAVVRGKLKLMGYGAEESISVIRQ